MYEESRFEVKLVASARLPTRYGEFKIIGFFDQLEGKEHTTLVRGEVAGARACAVRIHSECHTGDALGSLRCDCRDQLEASLRYLGSHPCGALIYLRQEGRGIGLLNKIRAYGLQDGGLDTVDANEQLGFPSDARDYRVASQIVRILGISSVTLLTNNPKKIEALRDAGIEVEERIPLVVPPNDYSAGYLETKRSRMGHLL